MFKGKDDGKRRKTDNTPRSAGWQWKKGKARKATTGSKDPQGALLSNERGEVRVRSSGGARTSRGIGAAAGNKTAVVAGLDAVASRRDRPTTVRLRKAADRLVAPVVAPDCGPLWVAEARPGDRLVVRIEGTAVHAVLCEVLVDRGAIRIAPRGGRLPRRMTVSWWSVDSCRPRQ